MDEGAVAAQNLVRWLRRQLREPTPEREHLEAAVAAEDVEEVRRILARSPLSSDQWRHVSDLLDRWERSRRS